MKRKHTTRFAFTNPRLLLSLFFCAIGVLIAVVALSFYPGSAQAERPNQSQTADKSGALTPEEASKMAQGIKPMVNRSSDGLVQVQRPNGVSMDLQGRFQNVMLAKKEANGTVSQSCVDNPESAAAFLQIDPALLGVKQSAKQSTDAQSANH